MSHFFSIWLAIVEIIFLFIFMCLQNILRLLTFAEMCRYSVSVLTIC